jgi:hypothetical protein
MESKHFEYSFAKKETRGPESRAGLGVYKSQELQLGMKGESRDLLTITSPTHLKLGSGAGGILPPSRQDPLRSSGNSALRSDLSQYDSTKSKGAIMKSALVLKDTRFESANRSGLDCGLAPTNTDSKVGYFEGLDAGKKSVTTGEFNPGSIACSEGVLNLNLEDSKKIIAELCELYQVKNPFLLMRTARKVEKIVKTVPKLEKFIQDVCSIVAVDPTESTSANFEVTLFAFLRTSLESPAYSLDLAPIRGESGSSAS